MRRMKKQGTNVKMMVSLFLTIAICLAYVPWSSVAVSAAEEEDLSKFEFAYLSDQEAMAFIGFLFNDNELDSAIKNTDVYLYLTGGLKNDPHRENIARIAFVSVAEKLLNARLDESHIDMTSSAKNICDFLENKYGTNAEYELLNELINDELKSLKNVILNFAAIATDTDMVEIDAVCNSLGIIQDVYEVIKNPQNKAEEYLKEIHAILDGIDFTVSVQRFDMYQQFQLYISHAQCYLNFGDSEITYAYIYLTQATHDLYNEKTLWANSVETIIKAIDVFQLLNEYWLDWDTDARINLLKKWAGFIAYSKEAAHQDISTTLCDYEIVTNSFTTENGTIIKYNSRNYNERYILTTQLSKFDIKYRIENNSIIIEDYIGYDGKYRNIAIPSEIDEFPVVAIEAHAFEGASFEGVIVPESVSHIGEYAFYNCVSLNRIVILGDRVDIGLGAFDWVMEGSDGIIADQTTGNIPIYCNENSSVKLYADRTEGFYYKDLNWDGTTIWGVDCANSIFYVYTANELAYIKELVNNGYNLEGYTIKLQYNIYLNNIPWTPIGNSSTNCFSGNVDGNGYTVTGLYSNNQSKCNVSSLFGYVTANDVTISDINVSGTTRGGTYNSGLIASLTVNNSGAFTAENISTNVSVSNGVAGGIISIINSSGDSDIKFDMCSNIGNVTTSKNKAGGIVGSINASKTDIYTFFRCSQEGVITSKFDMGYGSGTAGGLLGSVENGDLLVDQCAVVGEIYAKAYGPDCGGMIGYMKPHSFTIQDCEVFAYINSTHTNGDANQAGLVGGCYSNYYDAESEWIIKNTYVSSVMDGAYGKAGLVINSESNGTSLKNITVQNCYFDLGKTSITSGRMLAWTALLSGCNTISDKVNSSGTYSSSALRSSTSLYANWDFNNVWEYSDSGYPKLKSFDYEPCSDHPYEYTVASSPTETTVGITNYSCPVCHHSGSFNTCGLFDETYQIVRCVESPHNYPNNYNNTWTINKPGAKSIAITFSSQTETENGYDYIYIYDADGQQVGKYTGTALASKRILVNGDAVKIRLTSDNSRIRYGFALSYIEVNYSVQKDLSFSGASLTLQDNLTINYKVSASLFEEGGYTAPYVKFSLDGKETVVDTYTVAGDKYVFDFSDIAPHQMNDTIYATLYATYGDTVYQSETREYSVATYCYNTLAKYNTDDYAELRTLLVDLLHYGAKSQEYMDYNTDNLVNANLTEEQAAWGTNVDRTLETVQNTEYKAIDNPTVLWKGAGLNLQESVGMRFKIQAENIEDLTVKVVSGNSSCTITSDTFTKANGGYYVFFDKLNAGQMSKPVYLTVYEGGTAVSNTLCYSIESYAYAKQNDENGKLVELMKAMMKYGDAAYAYITPDNVETPDGDNEGIGSGDTGVDPWG